MAESNLERDVNKDWTTLHRTAVAVELQHCIIIIVGNDKDKSNVLKQILTGHSRTVNFPLHIFDNSVDCENFVVGDLYEDKHAKCVVFTLDQLANELIPCIVHSEQIIRINIIDDTSMSQEERESLKQYSKVKFSSDDETAKIVSHAEKIPDRGITQEERFNESMGITLMNADESPENIVFDTELGERSSQCFYSSSTSFRYFVLRLILEIQSMPSDMDNLIDLFRTKFLAPETSIDELRENYRADRAIQLYTKSSYIFEGLNKALRSLNIDYLLRYRFVLKDIHAQLVVLMANERNGQIRKVYRGQKMHFVELWSLFDSFNQRAPVIVNSFFSTSLERETAAGFLLAGTENQEWDMKNICVLFTIHIRQEDASSHWPFADISRLSAMHGEKEVLFAPNQMFMIDKFEVIYENGSYVYSVEMSFYKDTQFNFNFYYNRVKSQWKEHTDNPLVHFAQLLLMSNRYDQAKEIFEQVLKDKCDDQTKMGCYRGLTQIATFKNNSDEALAYEQKIMELKFGSQNASTLPEGVLLPSGFDQIISTLSSQCQNYLSQTSLDQPLHETSNYLENDEVNNFMQQTPEMTFMLAKALISQQQYQLAIMFLEPVLMMLRWTNHVQFDPSLKSKCYQAMGDCYRHLNLNEKALEYYTLALDGNVTLPPEQRIEILHGTGKALVATNQWETALENYIRAAEIFQTELPNADPGAVAKIEECIQQVTSHILSSNE